MAQVTLVLYPVHISDDGGGLHLEAIRDTFIVYDHSAQLYK